MKATLEEIVLVCDGEYYGDSALLAKEVVNIGHYLSDIDKENGFIFIEFRQTVEDAIALMESAYNRGALCCITDKKLVDMPNPFIYVDNIVKATQDLGAFYRKYIHIPIIGITGSVGKTCTKDMIVSVLSQKYNTLKTNEGHNTCHMLALGLFGLREKHEVAVLEAAIGPAEEMDINGNIVWPDIVVMTNIGEAHMSWYETQEDLFKAKCQLLDYMSPIGTAYLNGCDKFLKTITLDKPQRIRWYGMSEDMEYHPMNIKNLGLKGVNCDLVHGDTILNVTIPVPGIHYVETALIAFAVGLDFGVSLDGIKRGIESYVSTGFRTKVIDTGYISIIEDCYNASPKAVKANVDMLSELEGRKVFIFGGMLGLGKDMARYHEDVGKYIAEKRIDVLVNIGKLSEHIAKGVSEVQGACEVICLPDKASLPGILPDIIRKNDNVLVKASRNFKFEDITEMLKHVCDEDTVLKPPAMHAQNVILMDTLSGQVLYDKEGHEEGIPASTTKIATCILAIEGGNLDDICTIPDVIKLGTVAGVTTGEQMTFQDMLYGLMLVSANDLAEAIAIHISDSIEGFVDKMNDLARKLGMKSTNFSNPHGAPGSKHYSTPYDMALLARYAIQNPVFKKIVATPVHKCKSSLHDYEFQSTNALIHRMPRYMDQRYQYCIGGKTGSLTFRSNALPYYFSLVSYAAKDGKENILVQFNSLDESYRGTVNRFKDAALIHEWAFEQYGKLLKQGYIIE